MDKTQHAIKDSACGLGFAELARKKGGTGSLVGSAIYEGLLLVKKLV